MNVLIRSKVILLIVSYQYASLSSVSSQVIVVAFEGEDVLLPCYYSQAELPVERFSVFWRTKDDKNVYDILKGKRDLSNQAAQYLNRTDTFPDQYKMGNFSFVLQRARLADSDVYKCFIPKLHVEQQVKLTVKDNPVELQEGKTSLGSEENEVIIRGGSVAPTFNLSSLSLILLARMFLRLD